MEHVSRANLIPRSDARSEKQRHPVTVAKATIIIILFQLIQTNIEAQMTVGFCGGKECYILCIASCSQAKDKSRV